MGPFQTGNRFEKHVAEQLLKLKHKGLPIEVLGCAGASKGTDVRFRIGIQNYALEVKTKGAFEAGQTKFKVINGALSLPNECLLTTLIPGYIPFGGLIPPFLERRMTKDEWIAVKHLYPNEYTIMNSLDLVARYYNTQGSSYIQIEGYGLYKTSEDDPLELGVPIISCKAKVRVRCKEHASSPLSMSVNCSINYDKRSLVRSPYCLLSRLPPNLSLV
jgi:hypothetical protein